MRLSDEEAARLRDRLRGLQDVAMRADSFASATKKAKSR